MTLDQFLKEANMRPAQFAESIGVEASTVSRWLAGTRQPDIRMAVRIQDATGGKVTPRDFIDAAPAPAAADPAASPDAQFSGFASSENAA